MKTKRKAIMLVLCAVMLVVASVLGTMAYLTDSEQAVNTFTVGKVYIDLWETNTDGVVAGVKEGETLPEGKDRGNEYHLLPGHTYVKDPTVTVKEGSESSYIRMLVTINEQTDLNAIYAPDGMPLNTFFNGISADWTLVKETKDEANDTRTYEFRYKEAVAAPEVEDEGGDVVLDALFDGFTVPGEITKEQLATISDLNITIVAQAIQADGFTTADAAWDAFPAN